MEEKADPQQKGKRKTKLQIQRWKNGNKKHKPGKIRAE
jgi:hypothetical protein